MVTRYSTGTLLLLGLLCCGLSASGPDPESFKGLQWRNIGPFRGGRSTTVTGVPSQRGTFYFGTTGGGVWKTLDGGDSWRNVSDGFFKSGSIGAVAVADSDPNVVYVGTGEAPFRGVMSSSGDGVYKSTDAGQTWTHIGLDKTRQISAIRIHPRDPNVVYVAAQGSPWGDSEVRGIYRSQDGGGTWEKVLYVDERSGASDLSIDPTNPRILYAAFWDHRRKPWRVISGGPGSSIHKSSDGGDTWKQLSKGLPEEMGKIGVAVSPARPQRVWAIIEADEGGLFRSDDGGQSWTRVNRERVLRARAWYYTHVFADPVDEETVYVLNAPLMKSVDGGKTFKRIEVPHGDNHALWISPLDHQVLINGNDGGANVSYNGGRTWSTQSNQPTAQFYRVITDQRFPYYVYGGQQDNSTVAIASRSMDSQIGRQHWYAVGGCESAHVAFDPRNPTLVYAGCYQGIITEYNHRLGQERNVMAYPYLGLGSQPKDLKYRFNWNAPILVSQHDPKVIFHGGNVLLRSDDRGQSWREISPDLTRDEKEKQGLGGTPITNEAAGGETYNTILYVAESPHEEGVLWTGSDDGLVHLTRNGGADWQDVTPPDIGEAMINSIEVSTHDPAAAYLAVTRYKWDDFAPYLFKTEDYGTTWTSLTEGFEPEHFLRVVREDTLRPGLLYAGTEHGLYVSWNGGARWEPFQLNLPVTPITDLRVKDGDLVAATQGRAFWILDDIAPLRAWEETLADKAMHLFKPSQSVRTGGSAGDSPQAGENPPNGAILYYWLAQEAGEDEDPLELEILDSEGTVMRRYSSSKPEKSESEDSDGPATEKPLPASKGLNRFVWDLSREPVTKVAGIFVLGGLQGYRLAPGDFTVRLRRGEEVQEAALTIVQDPRTDFTSDQFAEQQRILGDLWQRADRVQRDVKRLRSVRRQVNDLLELTSEHAAAAEISQAGQELLESVGALERTLAQPKQETFQDVINFPNKLNARLLNLMRTIDQSGPPVTEGAKQLSEELTATHRRARTEVSTFFRQALPEFLDLLAQKQVPPVILPGQ
ncbi:MAG TPA: glycosyl hydrolase [Acidobacteriota bacterium]|nr:glycosyl hydrolase [Acidobacteriota bacterium]